MRDEAFPHGSIHISSNGYIYFFMPMSLFCVSVKVNVSILMKSIVAEEASPMRIY